MGAEPRRISVDFLRHGEPEGGDILRGRLDSALSETGWAQMRSATGLEDKQAEGPVPHWSQIISSPLQRCRTFAEWTKQHSPVPTILSIEEDWQEIDYGDWDGLPLTQWRQLAAEQFLAFRDDLGALHPPNGEAYLSFRERVLAAFARLAKLPDGSRVLIVTHGGVLRVILPTVLGMPLNRSNPLHIPFASISRVQLEVAEGRVNSSLIAHNTGPWRLRRA